MKLNYYPGTDSLYIDLSARPSTASREVSEGVVLDYDAEAGLLSFAHAILFGLGGYCTAHALNAGPGVRIEGRYLLLRSPGNPVVSHAIDDVVFGEVGMQIEELLTKVREGRLTPDPADKQACSDCEYRRLCRLYGR